jgi:outer membrane protein assembly factor BamB/serine/threonine protein kinase
MMANPAGREGQQLGNYRLMRLIGEGGFARVYLGEHIYLKTYAALKVPKLQLTHNDVVEFLTEARTSVGLEHPHIVRVLECGVEGGILPYMVMNYAPGGTLRQRYPRGSRLPAPLIFAYVKQVASALQYIHNRGLIHQDIKPENMLLGRNDEIMLSDFGIADIAHRTVTLNVQEVTGTACYMAPEQFIGKARPASDQYALGVVVYEWISGGSPFTGSFSELYSEHLLTPPPPLREKVPGISPEVELVVMKALAKDPPQRFASVQEFANALEQAGQAPQVSYLPSATEATWLASTLKAGQAPQSSYPPSSDITLPADTLKQASPISYPSPTDAALSADTLRRPGQLPQPSYPPPTPDPMLRADTLWQPGQSPPISYPAPPPDATLLASPFRQAGQPSQASPAPAPPGFYGPGKEERVPPPLSGVSGPQSGANKNRKGSRVRVVPVVALILLLLVGSLAFLLKGVIVFPSTTSHSHVSTTTTPIVRPTTPPPIYSAMFGFNLQHTHYNPAERTLSPTNVSHLVTYWTASATSAIYSSPAVANGLVYVSSTDRKLYAFDATTGKLRWVVTTGSPATIGSSFYSSPAVVGSIVYVGSEDGNLYAFNALSGTTIWKAPTGGAIYSSPAVAGDVVYIGSLDHNLYAFNARMGTPLWKASTGGAIYSSPAVADNVVYVGSNDSLFYAFNATTGSSLWTARTGYHINTSPAVANGVIYIGSDDSDVYAFQTAGCGHPPCAPFWTTPTQGYVFSSPAVANGVVYIGSHDGKLYALDAMKGTILWMTPTGGDIVSSPAVANGVVYVGSFDHKLYALDARTGGILWSSATGDRIYSSPTVVDGVVYVGSQDHQLYAFHLS